MKIVLLRKLWRHETMMKDESARQCDRLEATSETQRMDFQKLYSFHNISLTSGGAQLFPSELKTFVDAGMLLSHLSINLLFKEDRR